MALYNTTLCHQCEPSFTLNVWQTRYAVAFQLGFKLHWFDKPAFYSLHQAGRLQQSLVCKFHWPLAHLQKNQKLCQQNLSKFFIRQNYHKNFIFQNIGHQHAHNNVFSLSISAELFLQNSSDGRLFTNMCMVLTTSYYVLNCLPCNPFWMLGTTKSCTGQGQNYMVCAPSLGFRGFAKNLEWFMRHEASHYLNATPSFFPIQAFFHRYGTVIGSVFDGGTESSQWCVEARYVGTSSLYSRRKQSASPFSQTLLAKPSLFLVRLMMSKHNFQVKF